jgi:hypothetical protein
MKLVKYPRTSHLQGSRLQLGDEGTEAVPLKNLRARHLVVEEKLDGANAGISFDTKGKLWLQSRGHFLQGGSREKHFALFKQWVAGIAHDLWPVLQSRFVLFGEWLYAKHTIFYDELPAYFLEFDMLDTESGAFLSTERRRELLEGLPITSVPILFEGAMERPEKVAEFISRSHFKSANWQERLAAAAMQRGLDTEQVLRETDPSDKMEGLYIKAEESGQVVERFKYVRADFLTTVLDSGSHWLRRPILPNILSRGAGDGLGGTEELPL